MNKQISTDEIKKFNDKYKSSKSNIDLMNKITQKGIVNVCINTDIIKENKPIFNIELSETKRTNQKESSLCWIFSGLNFIKREISKELGLNPLNFELSQTFISFFDRLEKSNTIYNYVLYQNYNYTKINKSPLFNEVAHEYGRFELFKSIITKYGIVPSNIMKNTKNSLNPKYLNLLLDEKIKKDCVQLIKTKELGEDCIELKSKYLYENYEILSKTLGQPPETFDYSYTDLNNNKIQLKNITPLKFKEKFLKFNLDDYIGISNIDKFDNDFYRKYRYKNSGNIYTSSYVEYINLPIKRLKELTIKQLKSDIPVIFDCESLNFRDKASGVLDTRLYNYDKVFPFKKLNKTESINLRNIFARHVMVFTGVHIENTKPIRWKVEDSYGKTKGHNGYCIMNDNWFENYVVRIIINKKYLTDKELNVYNSKPIIIDNNLEVL